MAKDKDSKPEADEEDSPQGNPFAQEDGDDQDEGQEDGQGQELPEGDEADEEEGQEPGEEGEGQEYDPSQDAAILEIPQPAPPRYEATPGGQTAISTLRALLDRLDTRRAAEAEEEQERAAAEAQSTGLDAETIPDFKGEDVYLCFDGDDVGNAVARAEQSDDERALADVSARIEAGRRAFEDWVAAHNGKVVQTGGDEGMARVSSEALPYLEDFRRLYQAQVGVTVTCGVGEKMSEATRARTLGKLRGKDQVAYHDDSTEAELAMRLEDEAAGEGAKVQAAGLGEQPPESQEGTDAPVEDGGDQRTSAGEDEGPESEEEVDPDDEVQSGPDKAGGDEEPEDESAPQKGSLPDEQFGSGPDEAEQEEDELGREAEERTARGGEVAQPYEADDGSEWVGEATEDGEEPEDTDEEEREEAVEEGENPDLETFGDNPDEDVAEERDPDQPEGDEEEAQGQEQPASAGPGPDEEEEPTEESEEANGDLDGEGQGGEEEGEVSDEEVGPEGVAPDEAEPGAPETGPSSGQVGEEPGWDYTDLAPPDDEGERDEYRKRMGRGLAHAMRGMG